MVRLVDRRKGNRQALASLPPPLIEGTTGYGRKNTASGGFIRLCNSGDQARHRLYSVLF